MEVAKNNGAIAFLGMLVFAIVVALLVIYLEILGIAVLFALPAGVAFFYWVMQKPSNALVLTLICAFFAIGAIRYISAIPLGLTVDFALILAIISAIFHTSIKTDFKKIKNSLMLVSVIWMGYNVAEIINPEARSMAAWFYAVRGTALYMILTVPLTLLYANKIKDLDRFINYILLFSFLASLWGLRQYFIGLDAAEIRWLDSGPRTTHVLFGNLRVFSFFSDAGQFGAGIAHAGLMAAILALGPFQIRTKLIYAVLSLLFFYLMILTGTRGSLIVPVGGAMAFLFATKNFKIMAGGLILLGAIFFFLKFTTIAQDNYQVRRMRSALDPNDASLNVRKENQKKFKSYLQNRPFGGGIGTSGSWGQRFSPGTFLAETPNDSWYVKIWAEMGVVGLSLHLTILLFIALMALLKIWKVKDEGLKQKLLALFAGYIGIIMASYGNPILGQMPTGIVIYMSWAYLYLAPDLDKELSERNF